MDEKAPFMEDRRLPNRIRIFVQSSFDGLHHWPEAPEEVSFLRSMHRHQFQVRATFAVEHADRELEFFILKARLNKQLEELAKCLRKNPAMSCEMMAEYLLQRLAPAVEIEVSEDGENGAIVTGGDYVTD